MFRFPDKPNSSGNKVELLDQLEKEGGWIAQMKFDGWRDQMNYANGSMTHTSASNSPLAVGPKCLDKSVAGDYFPLNLKGRWIFDAEWMGKRQSDTPERLWVFDCLMSEGEWLCRYSFSDRFKIVQAMVPTQMIVPTAFGDFRDFFEMSKEPPYSNKTADGRWFGCEGLVLKRATSVYRGDIRGTTKNPDWIKVKWRDGEDGQEMVA